MLEGGAWGPGSGRAGAALSAPDPDEDSGKIRALPSLSAAARAFLPLSGTRQPRSTWRKTREHSRCLAGRGGGTMVLPLMTERILSDAEIEHFICRGFVRVSGCFSRELARDWTSRACERLYCSLDDPATWP